MVSMVAMDMHRDIPGRDKLPEDDSAEGGTDSLLNAEAARDMDVMDMPIISTCLLLPVVLTDRISVGIETSSEPRLYMESFDRRRGTPLMTVLVLAIFGFCRTEGNLGLKLGHPNNWASSIHDNETSTRHNVLGTIGIGLTPSSSKVSVDEALCLAGDHEVGTWQFV